MVLEEEEMMHGAHVCPGDAALGEINADVATLDCRVRLRTAGFIIAAINKANSNKASYCSELNHSLF